MNDTIKMSTFKKLDVVIQWLLIIGFVFVIIIRQGSSLVLVSYCVVGGWQVVSMLVHAITWSSALMARSTRSSYTILVLFILIFVPVCYLVKVPFLLYLAFLMAMLAPFMALFYAILCTRELLEKA